MKKVVAVQKSSDKMIEKMASSILSTQAGCFYPPFSIGLCYTATQDVFQEWFKMVV